MTDETIEYCWKVRLNIDNKDSLEFPGLEEGDVDVFDLTYVTPQDARDALVEHGLLEQAGAENWILCRVTTKQLEVMG